MNSLLYYKCLRTSINIAAFLTWPQAHCNSLVLIKTICFVLYQDEKKVYRLQYFSWRNFCTVLRIFNSLVNQKLYRSFCFLVMFPFQIFLGNKIGKYFLKIRIKCWIPNENKERNTWAVRAANNSLKTVQTVCLLQRYTDESRPVISCELQSTIDAISCVSWESIIFVLPEYVYKNSPRTSAKLLFDF